jgi:hypothetical protein
MFDGLPNLRLPEAPGIRNASTLRQRPDDVETSPVQFHAPTTHIAHTAPSNSSHQLETHGATQQPLSLSTRFDAETYSEGSSTNTRAPRERGRIGFPAPTGSTQAALLSEALFLVPLTADHEPRRFDAAAARWRGGWLLERPRADLAGSALVLAALACVASARCSTPSSAPLAPREPLVARGQRGCKRALRRSPRWQGTPVGRAQPNPKPSRRPRPFIPPVRASSSLTMTCPAVGG